MIIYTLCQQILKTITEIYWNGFLLQKFIGNEFYCRNSLKITENDFNDFFY